MDESRVREAFEAWYSDGGKWPKAVERSASGAYVLAVAEISWKAWRAAWAAAGGA